MSDFDPNMSVTSSGVGGPGGLAPAGPRGASSAGPRSPGVSAVPRAPSQADRPARKVSRSGGAGGGVGTPVLPPQTPQGGAAVTPIPAVSPGPGHQGPAQPPKDNHVPANQTLPAVAPMPQIGYPQRQGGAGGPGYNAYAPSYPPTPHARGGVPQAYGPTQLQRYQTNLANNMTSPALAALQRESDPLLEALDPFLARGQGWGNGANVSPPPRPQEPPVSQQITQDDLAYLGTDELQQLVSTFGNQVSGFPALHPEKVDISPPGSPLGPTYHNNWGRDPAAIVAEVEDREMMRAARELLEEKLEGLDIRRKALGNYYNTNQDLGRMDYANLYGTDPVRMAHLQKAARVDPFIKHDGLGIPRGVDMTRVPVGSVHRGYLEEGRAYVGNDILTVRDIVDIGWEEEDEENEGPVVRVAPTAVHGAAKSLLVGVGYVGTQYEIPEAGKNVDRMKAYLLENGFFGQQLTLRDDPSTPPDSLSTHANLLTAAKWLVEDARPGQSLFFYFTGRAQPSQENPSTTDLLPTDFDQAGAVPSAVLTSILANLAPGVKLTLLIDCFPSGAAITLPFKMHPTADYSFRISEGHATPSSAVVVQVSAMRDAPVEGPEPPSNLTHSFIMATSRKRKPTYRSLMLSMKKGLTSEQYVPCVSLNRPVDFKKAVFHLGAPESSGDDDPRLCDAKERTRSLARELGLAEEEAIAAAEERNLEAMKRAEEEQKVAEEKRKELEEAVEEVKRRMLLDGIVKGLRDVQDQERTVRARIKDEEATLRHNMARLKHEDFHRTLEDAIQGTGWSRVPAGENTGLPIVVGVKWQRPNERPRTSVTPRRGINPTTGQSVRHFAVIPPQKGDSPYYNHAPATPTHQHLQQPPHRPMFPDNKTIKWTRMQTNTDGTPQWVREEVTDEAGTPERYLVVGQPHPVHTAPFP